MTEQQKKVPVDELMNVGMELARRLAPTHAEAVVSEQVRDALSQHVIDGVSVARPDAEVRLRAAYEQRFDETLAADLVLFDREAKATARDLEARIDTSRRPPVARDDIRELLHLMRWQGRTLSDLAAAYERTPDKDDPVFIRMVEEEPRDVSRLFKLTPHDDDGPSVMRLKKSIHDRQTAREDKAAADALRALHEFRTRNLLLSNGVRQAQAGRLEVARMRRSHAAS